VPPLEYRETETVARRLKLDIRSIEVRRIENLDGALAVLKQERVNALILAVFNPALFANRSKIVGFAAQQRLPAIYAQKNMSTPGGFMAYGPSVSDLYRRAATYVDKILKGARPVDLPVEQPTKFELVINLKTAKTLGLTIPPALLQRADHVIQ
jgi:putative ABC transport system substrate-binding protein